MAPTAETTFHLVQALGNLGTKGSSSFWQYVLAISSSLISTLSILSLGQPQNGLPQRDNAALSGSVSECQDVSRLSRKHWTRAAANPLEILMQGARYTPRARAYISSFFSEIVIPYLGFNDGISNRRWKSFMTDDHTPIELSWDWRGPTDRPLIRFSVEPVGLKAGTSTDPFNQTAPESFKNKVLDAFPNTNTAWFDHFDSFFNQHKYKPGQVEGHSTSIFWAFDLSETKVVPKAYFFPGPLAHSRNMTNFETIVEAISAAPNCTPDKLQALNELGRFVDTLGPDTLEFDMLAIDLEDPKDARLKLYFRNRNTTFRSVRETVTLCGKKPGEHLNKGLEQLKSLWMSLFEVEDNSEDEELHAKVHRTAGALYNAEFRLGSKYADVKIYIPVRHYAKSDHHVLETIAEFREGQSRALAQAGEPAPQGPPMIPASAYTGSMEKMFKTEALRSEVGIHTYVGCSIKEDGALRIVSYINPQVDKLR